LAFIDILDSDDSQLWRQSSTYTLRFRDILDVGEDSYFSAADITQTANYEVIVC
jgi:hypothetical protein